MEKLGCHQGLIAPIAILQQSEDEILRWLARSKENLIAFSLDPVDALFKSKLEINNRILRNINRFRRSNLKAQPLKRKARLRTVTITVSPETSENKKEG